MIKHLLYNMQPHATLLPNILTETVVIYKNLPHLNHIGIDFSRMSKVRMYFENIISFICGFVSLKILVFLINHFYFPYIIGKPNFIFRSFGDAHNILFFGSKNCNIPLNVS